MSSLWKMAAHWNGAAVECQSYGMPSSVRVRLTMLGLASGAMAQLRVQWLLTRQLVLDLAAVAARLVTDLEVLVGFVDSVRRSLLPLRQAFGLLTASLIFVHFAVGVLSRLEAYCRNSRSERECTRGNVRLNLSCSRDRAAKLSKRSCHTVVYDWYKWEERSTVLQLRTVTGR